MHALATLVRIDKMQMQLHTRSQATVMQVIGKAFKQA